MQHIFLADDVCQGEHWERCFCFDVAGFCILPPSDDITKCQEFRQITDICKCDGGGNRLLESFSLHFVTLCTRTAMLSVRDFPCPLRRCQGVAVGRLAAAHGAETCSVAVRAPEACPAGTCPVRMRPAGVCCENLPLMSGNVMQTMKTIQHVKNTVLPETVKYLPTFIY